MKTATRSYHQGARAESAEATGRRIIEAFLARLMDHWFDEITLDRVAEDAGVTVQTVVRRWAAGPFLGPAARRFGGPFGPRTAAEPVFTKS